MKYRKKSVEIEAIQFIGDFASLNNIQKFVGGNIKVKNMGCSGPISIVIKTLEGNMKVTAGDYIIKDVNGEFYPCKPDIFEKIYEIVN